MTVLLPIGFLAVIIPGRTAFAVQPLTGVLTTVTLLAKPMEEL